MYVPRWKYGIGGTYTLPLAEKLGDISFSVNYVWTGSQYVSADIQAKLSEAGSIPVKRSAFGIAKPGNRLIPVALQQLDAGALPRPRTPDWAKVEELLGIELNKALQAGSGGGAALDNAAKQVKDYLSSVGYY